MLLSSKKRYLHIALNSTLDEAYAIIQNLPVSERIILEAGTPLIKRYGTEAITSIRRYWEGKLWGTGYTPYVVADMKTMDRAETEVVIAKEAGASGVICLGQAPFETLNSFVGACRANGVDSFIDMMNIDQPVKVMRSLKKLPDVVLLHRGVDEETFNKSKPIPYIQINKILSSYNCLIAIAGGDTIREVQRAVFNGAQVVVVWKEFFHRTEDTANLAGEFLREIK